MKSQMRGVALLALVLILSSAQPVFARSREDHYQYRDVVKVIQKWAKSISKLIPTTLDGLTDPKP